MKKYLYSIVFATLILISTTVVKASNEVYYTNRENIEMTEEEYNNLLGMGFTEKQIYRMDQETFLENKDIQGTILSEAGKYLKQTTIMRNGIKTYRTEEITEEEAIEEARLQSQEPTRGPSGNYYDGVFATNVIYVKNKIIGISNAYMRFKIDVEWLTMPSHRYNDIIGIGFHSSDVRISSVINFREDWLTSNNTFGHDLVCAPKSESTGGSAIFALPSGSLVQLESYLYFNVTKQDGVGTITDLYTSGSYAHAYNYVNGNILFNYYHMYYGGGLDIDTLYDNDYDITTPAYASFHGTW